MVIFDKLVKWFNTQQNKSLESRFMALHRFGLRIGEEIYRYSNEGRVLEDDLANSKPTDVLRYTCHLRKDMILEYDFYNILNGERLRKPYHSLSDKYFETIMESISQMFFRSIEPKVIRSYNIRKLGVSLVTEEYIEIYIELYKQKLLKQLIFDKCLKLFNDNKLTIDTFINAGTSYGSILTVLVNVNKLDVDLMTNDDIAEVCDDLKTMIEDNIIEEYKDSCVEVTIESNNYFNTEIKMSLKLIA